MYATAANRILTLNVLKVSNQLAQLAGITSPEEVPSVQEQADPLSWLSVTWMWPSTSSTAVELVDGHIHVIVVPPSSKKSNITLAPTELTLDIEAIDEKVSKELDSGMLRGMVEIFLKDPEPRPWIPPDFVTPGNQKFLTNLQIPSYRNNNPSLLLHNLDVCNDKEIEMIFGPGTHQYVDSVVINCALNTSQHRQAGSFAIHLARGKPVACWKASQNTGGFTLL